MSAVAQQIPFNLGHRTAMEREDFLIAPSNQDAVAWIDLWPEWPAPVLILYGPVASGKSHLAAVWRTRAQAQKMLASELTGSAVENISRGAGHVVIDDADALIGDVAAEKELFHLYNVFKEQKRSLMLTMVEAPVRRAFTLPDLASRLRAAPSVAIREPDDALLAAVLVKLFNDRQLRVSTDVVNYLIPRIERSFESLRQLVELIDQKALSEKKNITATLIRDIIS